MLSSELIRFVGLVPTIDIESEKVENVRESEFEKQIEGLEAQLKNLHEDKAQVEKQLADNQTRITATRKEMEERNALYNKKMEEAAKKQKEAEANTAKLEKSLESQ